MSTHRTFRPEIRAVDGSNGRQFWAMPLAYEVVDDYGTIWTRGVFDASVGEGRMPVLLYGHDWSNVGNVLGRAVDYSDGPDGPRALFELTDFDDHPHTRQVAAQINEGTMTDMSVGFDRRRWAGPGGERGLDAEDGGRVGPTGVKAYERMLEAGWDETSLVVRGAVPGAKVLSAVRSKVRTTGGLMVPTESVLDLARRLDRGEITHDEALAAITLLGQPDENADPPAGDETDLPVEGTDPDALVAEAAAVLDALEG